MGRIYEDRHTLPGLRWFWSITMYVNPSRQDHQCCTRSPSVTIEPVGRQYECGTLRRLVLPPQIMETTSPSAHDTSAFRSRASTTYEIGAVPGNVETVELDAPGSQRHDPLAENHRRFRSILRGSSRPKRRSRFDRPRIERFPRRSGEEKSETVRRLCGLADRGARQGGRRAGSQGPAAGLQGHADQRPHARPLSRRQVLLADPGACRSAQRPDLPAPDRAAEGGRRRVVRRVFSAGDRACSRAQAGAGTSKPRSISFA